MSVELRNVLSYNNWLREQNLSSLSMLAKNTVRLQAQLPVLLSLLEQETTMEPSRALRVNSVMNHLMTELHLLVTMIREAD